MEVMGSWPSKICKNCRWGKLCNLLGSSTQSVALRRILAMNPQVQHASACWLRRKNIAKSRTKRLRIGRYIHCHLQMVSRSSLSVFATCSVGRIRVFPRSTRPVHWMQLTIADDSLHHKTEHQGMFSSQFPFIRHCQEIGRAFKHLFSIHVSSNRGLKLEK